MLATALLKVLLDLSPSNLHNGRILHGARHCDLLGKLTINTILDQFSEYTSQRLARPRLGNHAFALDDASQRRKCANLLTYKQLDLARNLGVWHSGLWVFRDGEGDECEGELAFELVGNADYAAFCDKWVG